jgi:heme-degrading monooxygenase HmoA
MSSAVCRVDRFTVPASARSEFLAQVRATHAILRTLPGFRQEFLLERESAPGTWVCVTLVEWTDAAAIEAAKAEMERHFARSGFHPRQLVARLGIEAELGVYRSIADA